MPKTGEIMDYSNFMTDELSSYVTKVGQVCGCGYYFGDLLENGHILS